MAKVGIISIFDMTNVGNRLQQYGLVKALEQLGHTLVIIPNEPYDGRLAASVLSNSGHATNTSAATSMNRRVKRFAAKVQRKLPQLSPNEL